MKVIPYIFLILTIVLFTTGHGRAVEIFGYYEPQYLGAYIDDEYSQMFTNKLRVDLQSSEIDNVTFGANFDYITYTGRTEWNLLEYLPKSIASSVPASDDSLFDIAYEDSIFLDNAYVKFAFSKFDITLGKQQTAPGTGYAWNPTDIFNTKDIIDPTYEQPGHTAIRLDAALSPRYNAMAILFPEDDWSESGKLIRFKGSISRFDYGVIYTEKMWQLSDYINFAPINRKRRLYGGDFAGELFGLGVWGEFGYNALKDHTDFWEILLGADYTFDNGVYFMAEYLHNELGKSNHEKYDLNDWLRFFAAESRTLSQDNLYLYVDYTLSDFIHVNSSFITSLSDQSISIVPSMQYSMYQNVEMNIFVNFNIGSDNRAYSNEQGYSGLFRFKIYF